MNGLIFQAVPWWKGSRGLILSVLIIMIVAIGGYTLFALPLDVTVERVENQSPVEETEEVVLPPVEEVPFKVKDKPYCFDNVAVVIPDGTILILKAPLQTFGDARKMWRTHFEAFYEVDLSGRKVMAVGYEPYRFEGYIVQNLEGGLYLDSHLCVPAWKVSE